jgi:hypothetical protein
MFAVEPAYVETAGAICIEIRNRLAAPKIDSPLIIGGDVGAGSAAPVKKVISSSALAVPELARSDDAKARVSCVRETRALHWSSDPRTSTRKAVRLGSCGRGLGASRCPVALIGPE